MIFETELANCSLSDDSRPYTPTYPRTKRNSFNYESDDDAANILKDEFSVLPTKHPPSPVYLSRPKTPQLQQAQSPVPMQPHAFTSVVVVAPTVTFPTDTVVTPSAIQTQSRQSSYIVSKPNKQKIIGKSHCSSIARPLFTPPLISNAVHTNQTFTLVCPCLNVPLTSLACGVRDPIPIILHYMRR